jgi:hypothetical protein
MINAVQINCPFCHAAQTVHGDGHYTCDFCLQPFSTVQAEQEESRLLKEIKDWVQDKVGFAGSSASIDTSSRGFIFQNRILPEVRRDVDRSLESLGNYASAVLIVPPVPPESNTPPNPLIANRTGILALKSLRARLSSEQVSEFALSGADKHLISDMDRRLGDVMHMSNVADAATRRDDVGYSTARRNLEALALEAGETLAAVTGDRAAFVACLQARYRSLSSACEVYARLCQHSPSVSVADAETLVHAAEELVGAADGIEKSNYSPADAMPFVIAVREEAHGCRTASRWIRSHAQMHCDVAFPAFVASAARALSDVGSAGGGIDLVEVFSTVLGAARGESAVGVVADRSWVGTWAEGHRAKKTFGLLGNEENLANLREFFIPVWCADLTYSKAAGAVFKSGVEQRCLVAVPACRPKASDVLIIESRDHAIARAVLQPSILQTSAVALPSATWEQVRRVFLEALGRRPDLLNCQLRMKGIAFVPAAVATFNSKKGQRELGAWLDGTLSFDEVRAGNTPLADSFLKRLAQSTGAARV